MKCQLANNPQDTERITQEFADADKIFLLNQKVDEAWKLFHKGDYSGAIKLHNEAIELNPNHTNAKNNREACLKAMGK